MLGAVEDLDLYPVAALYAVMALYILVALYAVMTLSTFKALYSYLAMDQCTLKAKDDQRQSKDQRAINISF